MSHVGFSDHYDPPAGPDHGAAQDKAQANASCGLESNWSRAIDELEVLLDAEIVEYAAECGMNSEDVDPRDLDSDLSRCFDNVVSTALSYLRESAQRANPSTLARIKAEHAHLKRKCHQNGTKALWRATGETIEKRASVLQKRAEKN